MPTPNSFLQSPFQTLIAQQEEAKPLPGSDPVKDAALPDLSADPVPAPAGTPAPSAKPSAASLLPPENLRPLFEATAAHFKVPVNVLMAITQQESSYNPDATNKDTGAAGMAQYMDATAKSLGINPRDPNEAVPAAAMQLRERLDKGYSVEDAVKEHFAGPDRKLWGNKTAAYGQEVLAKAGAIGKELYGDAADAPAEAGKPASPDLGPEQNQFAPTRMRRGDYEKNFKAMNPRASQAAVDMAMAQYDKQVQEAGAARAKAKTIGPKPILTPEQFFDARLNERLQGPQDGVVPQLPAREQPVAFPETTTQHIEGQDANGSDLGAAASYLGKSAKSGVYNLAGAGAKLFDALNPFTLSESDAATLFKDDPAKLKEMQDESASLVLSRFAKAMQAKGDAAMEQASPDAKRKYGSLEWATLDQNKAAYNSPVKVVGDAVRSLPSSLALALSAYLTRGASLRAEQAALQAGLSAEAASAAGIAAGAKMMGQAGAVGEGGIGYAQQANQTASDASKVPMAEMQKSPVFQALLKQGFTPETARAKIIADTAEHAGQIAGLVDATVNKFGGEFLGKIISEGGAFIPRVLKGMANESATEFVQSAGEQVGQNFATKTNINTNQSLTEGVAEAAVAGAGVGGLMGGVTAGVAGHHAPLTPEQEIARAIEQQAAGAQFEQPVGQVALQRMDPNGGVAIDPRDTVRPPAPPAAPAGPLTAAVEAAAPRPVFQADDEGFMGQILGDDGQVHTIDSRTGVIMTEAPAAPAGPLEAAIADAAEQHAANPAPLPAVPQEAPQPPALESLPLEDLRAQLKQVAAAAKADPSQALELRKQRAAIEKEIGARAKQAKADSKPAEEPLSAGPFEDIKAANRMMLRYAEQTGTPHQVVGSEGSFEVKPIGESNGINPAGAARGPDGHGRSGEPADAVGRADGKAGSETGRSTRGSERAAGSRAVAGELSDAGADRAGADGATDAQPALTEPAKTGTEAAPYWKTNPYHARAFPDQGKAEAFMDNKQVDREQFEVVQTGPVRWQVKPRAAPAQDSFAQEVTADVPESPQVPEEAPAAQGEKVAQPLDASAAAGAETGAGAAPSKPKRKPSQRELTNARQEEVVKAAAEKLAARKAEKEAAAAPMAQHDVAIVKAAGTRSADVDKTLAGLPPVADGHVRLFRAESPTTKFEDVFDVDGLADFKTDKPGARYTDDLKYADYYRTSYGKDAKIHYIDVPKAVAEKGRVNDYEYAIEADGVRKAEQPQPAAETSPAPTQAEESVKAPAKPKRKKAAPKAAEPVTEQDEGVRYSVSGDQTDTPAFRAWFGKSVVVDKDGKPLVVYHGTNADVSELKSKGELHPDLPWTRGIYFTADPAYASRYADQEGANVMPVYLKMENPKIVTDSGFKTASISKEAMDQLRAEGYDGIINHADDEYIVFDSAQVKSATGNDGTFDPASPDIRYSTDHPLAGDAPRAVSPLVQSLADKGAIVLHQDASTLPVKGKAPSGVQALTTADGTIHVVANALGDNANGIILHEAFHAGTKALIGSAAWDGLNTRLGSLYRQGEQTSGAARAFWDAARARVETAKAKGAVAPGMEHEEFGAYAIEEYAKAPASIRKWVDDLLGAVKAWALRRFGKQLGDVTPAQLSSLAKLALLDAQAVRSADHQLQPAFSADSSKTIEVDGQRRPIENSKGQLIAPDMHKQMAFWRWAKDTAVVDDKGRPRVVYHGTADDFSTFDKSKRGSVSESSDSKLGFFFTDSTRRASMAAEDAGYPGGENVMPVYLRMTNPLVHTGAQGLPSETARIIRRAIKGGHDGVIFEQGERGGQDYVVFEPEQIKSATGNDGSFSGDTPDIRYSVAGAPQPRVLTPDEQKLFRRVQAAVQDSMNRVRQVQDRIGEITGVQDLAGADYYLAETNRPGRIAARKEDGRDKLVEPMMRRLAKAGYTPDQLSELLHAQHAEERNEAVARINPEFPDGGSGMSTKKAEQIIARYQSEPALLALADEARQIARETLEMKKEYGLITQAQYDALATSYDNYVPLKGDGEYGPKVKRAMGHGDREEHIIENIARDFEQAIVVGEKNLARQSLLQMVLQYPDDALWAARVPPKGRYVAGTVFEISPVGTRNVEASFTSQSQVAAWLEAKGQGAAGYEVNISGGERVTEFTKPLQDNEVMVYVKGSPVRLQIHDEVLARQLRPLHTEMMNTVLGFMQKHNRYLSMIYTGYNPQFILKNAVRDMITGTINMTGNHGAVTAAKAWAKYPAAWATLLKWAMTKNIPAGPMGDALREYRAMGGKVGASYMSDLEEQGKSLQRMFDDQRGFLKTAMDVQPGDSRTWRAGFTKANERRAAAVAAGKTIGKLAHAIEVLNQAFENALRLALFAQLRAEGQKPGQAAQAAKTVTVNFDRKGTATPYLGAFYLFINPAIQGTANLTNTLAHGEHKAQAWALAGMMAAAGFAAAVHGMDDDKDRWLGEKWDTRTKNLRIRVGSHTINIPLSQEYAPFYAVGVAMGEVRRGESSLRASAHVLSSFLDAYYPMQGAIQPGSDNYGMDLLLAHVPTVGKMTAQIAANRNSFGNKIVPETDNTKNRPDNLKMYRGTKNSAYDASAQGIAAAGQALGADKYGNDLSKVSPETLKLIWSTYTGGLGKFVADSAGLGAMVAQGPGQIEVGDMPVVKDFVKADKMLPIRTRYFDLADQAQDAIDQFAAAKKQHDAAEMQHIAGDPAKRAVLGLGKMVGAVNKIEAAYSDMAVNVNADKTLGPADKRARLKELEDKQEAIYRKAIAAFKK